MLILKGGIANIENPLGVQCSSGHLTWMDEFNFHNNSKYSSYLLFQTHENWSTRNLIYPRLHSLKTGIGESWICVAWLCGPWQFSPYILPFYCQMACTVDAWKNKVLTNCLGLLLPKEASIYTPTLTTQNIWILRQSELFPPRSSLIPS